jgi:hypothetical protein
LFHRGRTEADLPPLVKHIWGDRRSLGDLGSEFRRFAPEVVLDMIPMNEVDARGLVAAFRGIAPPNRGHKQPGCLPGLRQGYPQGPWPAG